MWRGLTFVVTAVALVIWSWGGERGYRLADPGHAQPSQLA